MPDPKYYTGEPGSAPWDHEQERRPERPEEPRTQPCEDCGDEGRRSVIAHDGTSRTYCGPCYRIRAWYGWEFEPRSLKTLTDEEQRKRLREREAV